MRMRMRVEHDPGQLKLGLFMLAVTAQRCDAIAMPEVVKILSMAEP